MKKRILAILIAFAMIVQGIIVCDLGKVYAEDSIYDGGNIVAMEGGSLAVIDENNVLWMRGCNYGIVNSEGTTEAANILEKVMEDVVSVVICNSRVAYIKKDGSLWMWGNNSNAQLGDGTNEDKLYPIKILDDVLVVAMDNFSTVAIKKDGSLWRWGYNYNGNLGDGTNEDKLSPVKIMDDVKSISIYDNKMAIVKKDGSLWTCGDNRYGQLCDGTTESKSYPTKVMDGVKWVTIGERSTGIIKKDDSLWLCGTSEHVDLGNGYARDMKNPTKIMDEVSQFVINRDYDEDDSKALIKNDGSLWMWGSNSGGELGDGTRDSRQVPVKIMNDVVSLVKTDDYNAAAIKKDGSLWIWGDNHFGEIGSGEFVFGTSTLEPKYLLDNVIHLISDENSYLAIKEDGTLWLWGYNANSILGGANRSQVTPTQIKGIKVDPAMLNTVNYALGENIYTVETPAPILPVEELNNVNSQTTAENATKKALDSMTYTEKKSDLGADAITHYGEVASQLATQKTTTGEINITTQISGLETQAMSAKTKTEALLMSSGVTTTREVRSGVSLNTEEENLKVVVNSQSVTSQIEMVRVNSTDYGITVEPQKLKEDVANEELIITVEKVALTAMEKFELMNNPVLLAQATGIKVAVNTRPQSKYKVTFSKKTSENITLSLPIIVGNSTYQVIKKDGQAIASKYNPNTEKIEAKINEGGIYTVEINEKSFQDISNKSKEMQEAIKYLASKGIINGKSETKFDPDGQITRAEIAALLTRSLSKLDPSIKNTFTDVNAADWYYVAAISANKAGLFKGNEKKQFMPTNKIQKDQLTAVVSRVLVSEMGYKAPTDTTKYVTYVDAPRIQAWAVPEIALAARENLVIKRTDNAFNPTYKMTRGEAAVVLMRMFGKLW